MDWTKIPWTKRRWMKTGRTTNTTYTMTFIHIFITMMNPRPQYKKKVFKKRGIDFEM